ncbi:hypothetical protein KKG52_00705 [Patescibacteria group bacterium]|nr:hypothetical protein [Patescibacteria group bacterium]
MKNNNLENLIKELKIEGASEKETEGLLKVVGNLKEFNKIERSFESKRRFLDNPGKATKNSYIRRWFLIPAISFALLLLVGGYSVVAAQNSLPGDKLYSVKKATEKIISTVNPSFKEEIIIRRSQEVGQLVEKKESTELIKKSIYEYKKAAEEDVKQETREESSRNIQEAIEKSKEEDREELKEIIREKEKVLGEEKHKNQEEQNKEREEFKND